MANAIFKVFTKWMIKMLAGLLSPILLALNALFPYIEDNIDTIIPSVYEFIDYITYPATILPVNLITALLFILATQIAFYVGYLAYWGLTWAFKVIKRLVPLA